MDSTQTCVRLAGRARLQEDPVTREPILLYPEGLLKLNPTGARILQILGAEGSAHAIATRLAQECGKSAEDVLPSVTKFLGRLRDLRLLEDL
jgi:pyrroloquinoline quinone biosynthesis protein D